MELVEILKTIKKKNEEFYNFPTSEKLKINREMRVTELLNVGYITPDEAKVYKNQLVELPKDKKGLVVAYFLLGMTDDFSKPPMLETFERITETIASFNLRERGVWRNGKSIADTLTGEEQNKLAEELIAIHIKEKIKRAEAFVYSKRNRIRSRLLRLFPMEIALSLSEPKPENELDSIPYLREVLQNNGYKGKCKTLSDEDNQAIQAAALHYLDLIECAFLSGIGRLRYEEYKEEYLNDGETEFVKSLLYRDVYDEVLTEFEFIYLLMHAATTNFYTDGTPKEAIDFMGALINKLLKEELKDKYNKLKGGKFSCLLEEDSKC